ncbi:MAG: hypothetical protein Q8R11_02000 [bacterium]|nr:hypothetical protein [bacterium]
MERETFQERCGIVAIYTPEFTKKFPTVVRAQVALQHRGQNAGGFAMQTEGGVYTVSGFGLIREILKFDSLQDHDPPTLWTVGHNRYETVEGKSENNTQPIVVKTHDGETLIVAHNGELVLDETLTKYRDDPHVSDTYMFSHLLANTKGTTWTERVLHALEQIRGSYSMVICVGEEMFLARDPFGFRPLVFGQVADGWMAASETHAFDKIFDRVSGKILRMIHRGEVVRITKKGPTTVREGFVGSWQSCMFEAPYLAFPYSRVPTYEQIDDDDHPERWMENSWFRRRMGKILAEEAPIRHASFVVGIPDSGMFVAEAYAETLGLPLRHYIVRDHYTILDRRSFMSDDLTRQNGEADGKKRMQQLTRDRLSFESSSSIWTSKIVVMPDDSNVRGLVAETVDTLMFHYGAAEVHGVYGYPMIIFSCNKGVSMRRGQELVAFRHNSDEKKIAAETGLTSIHHISHAGYVRAMRPGISPEQIHYSPFMFMEANLCGQCVTAVDPVEYYQHNGKLRGEFTLPAILQPQRQTALP